MATINRNSSLHQRRTDAAGNAVLGGHGRRAAAPKPSTGKASHGRPRAVPRPRTPTRASPHRPDSARPSRRDGKIRTACRSRPSCSAAAAPLWFRSCSSPSAGSTACSSAPPWRPRPPRRQPAPSVSCATIRWPCCRSAATTWATTSVTGCRWASAWKQPPLIFRVNWFRMSADGRFLWPGYGENLRVLRWVIAPRARRNRGGRDADRFSAAPAGHRYGRHQVSHRQC